MNNNQNNNQDIGKEVEEIFDGLTINLATYATLDNGCGKILNLNEYGDGCLVDTNDIDYQRDACFDYDYEESLDNREQDLRQIFWEKESNQLSDEEEIILAKHIEFEELNERMKPILSKINMYERIMLVGNGRYKNSIKIKLIKIDQESWLLEKGRYGWRMPTDQLVKYLLFLRDNDDIKDKRNNNEDIPF